MSKATRIVVFDTETTGLSPAAGDRIVEIGAVELVGLEAARTFHRYVNPERDVPDEVVRVHGLTAHFLRDKPLFSGVYEDLLEFLGNDLIVAHNSEFDRAFLNAELARVGLPEFPRERFIDTLDEARKKLRAGTRLSLDGLARHYRLDEQAFGLAARKGPGGHGALVDAKILAEIYVLLSGGRERVFDFFEQSETAQAADIISAAVRARPRLAPMELLSTLEERAAHAAFVAKLPGGTLWDVSGAT